MKKIITLLIAVTAFAATHAQTSKEEARRVVLGQQKNKSTSQEGRDVILGGGNNSHDYPAYPNSKSSRIEQDRERKICKANQGNGYGKKKGKNGKHLGWEKGKGNPHKYDSKVCKKNRK
jgi:hypothetical protein